jgi:uncharacterized protein YndB with AHSA1/START domain
MRVEETFHIDRTPEEVFDFMVEPSNLPKWQTAKTDVHALTPGRPGPGMQICERTKGPGGREWEQIVEFTTFERGQRLHVSVIQGPQPIDGDWALTPDGVGTRVDFTAEGELRGVMRFLSPIVAAGIKRSFAQYHRELRRHLEADGAPSAAAQA